MNKFFYDFFIITIIIVVIRETTIIVRKNLVAVKGQIIRVVLLVFQASKDR